MSYTVSDVVTRALKRTALVTGASEALTEDLAEGLATYNAVMFALEADGLELHDASNADYAHSTQSLTDAFPIAPKFFEHIASLIIEGLLDSYSKQPTQLMVRSFRDAKDTLYAEFLKMEDMSMPNGLVRLSRSSRAGGTI